MKDAYELLWKEWEVWLTQEAETKHTGRIEQHKNLGRETSEQRRRWITFDAAQQYQAKTVERRSAEERGRL